MTLSIRLPYALLMTLCLTCCQMAAWRAEGKAQARPASTPGRCEALTDTARAPRPARLSSVARPAARTDERLEGVRARIAEMVMKNEVPSVAVAVVKDGSILWEEGFGCADKERGVRATPHTMYPVASVSKSITATGLMLLVQRGLVDLDTPASKYIAAPAIAVRRGRAGDLTVRSLLDMTAGIPHLYLHYWNDEGVPVPAASELIRRYGFSAFPPGEHFHYSNLSYGVLEVLVEGVTGKKFGSFMTKEVFLPLGMRRTALTVGPALARHAAVRYAPGEEGPQPYRLLEPEGGVGFWSSAHDLALYSMLHLKSLKPTGSRVLRDSTLDKMHKTVDGKFYQFGWAHLDEGTGRVAWVSNGGMVGATSIVKIIPSEKMAVVVLTNIAKEERVTDRIADEVIDALLPGYAERLKVTRDAGTDVPEMFRPRPFVATSRQLGSWEGTVALPRNNLPISLTFDPGGKVFASLGGQPPREVKNLSVEEAGLLVGNFDGPVPTPDTSAYPHGIGINLRQSSDELFGYLFARSAGSRPRFGLPFYTRLSRKK